MNQLRFKMAGSSALAARRSNVLRLRSPEYSWDDARAALESIFFEGLAGADRVGLFRRNFLGFQVRVKDVATALGMLFRGEALFARTPQSRFEKIRDLRDLREIHSLWGVQAARASQTCDLEEALVRVA